MISLLGKFQEKLFLAPKKMMFNHDMTNSGKQKCRADTSLQNIKIIIPLKIRCPER